MNRMCWVRLALIVVVVGSLLASPVQALAQATPDSVASPTADVDAALKSAVTWLQSQQGEDGGWVGFSGASDVGITIDAVLALVAASNRGIQIDLTSASAFITANGLEYADSGTGAAAKVVMAAVALGLDPQSFGGVDLIEQLEDGRDSNTDLYGSGMYDHALFILAMVAAGEEIPEDAIDEIDERQLEEGSWSFDGTEIVGNGDTNTTAIVIQALAAAGATEGDLVLHGIEYLAGVALPNGFAFQPGPGAVPDANSTALVVQALIAAGENPTAQEWQNVAGSLLAFQNESGSFSYQLDPRDENLFATVQVIPAIAAQPLPIQTGNGASPEALPNCTTEQLATPDGDAQLPCAA